jgi:hypothetical protein
MVRSKNPADWYSPTVGNLNMKKPHLEITQSDKSGLHGKCSSCDTYFTCGGIGLARNPEAAMRTKQRQFDKHCKQVHMREDSANY